VKEQYPVLSPRLTIRDDKTVDQRKDRIHLIERFGFEPVHLLRSQRNYPEGECLQACMSFGDTVFVFGHLYGSVWSLSEHEVAVRALSLHQAKLIYTSTEESARAELPLLFPNAQIKLFNKETILWQKQPT
jgi:hypothetical protein